MKDSFLTYWGGFGEEPLEFFFIGYPMDMPFPFASILLRSVQYSLGFGEFPFLTIAYISLLGKTLRSGACIVVRRFFQVLLLCLISWYSLAICFYYVFASLRWCSLRIWYSSGSPKFFGNARLLLRFRLRSRDAVIPHRNAFRTGIHYSLVDFSWYCVTVPVSWASFQLT